MDDEEIKLPTRKLTLTDGEKKVIVEDYEDKLRHLAYALKDEVRDHGSLDWERSEIRFLNAARRIMWSIK